jgi:hypothetical protein
VVKDTITMPEVDMVEEDMVTEMEEDTVMEEDMAMDTVTRIPILNRGGKWYET